MPPNSDLINRFQMSQTMAAFAKGQLMQFDLTSTSQLLPALATCVAQAQIGSPSAVNIRIPGNASSPVVRRTLESATQSELPQVTSLKMTQPSADAQIEAIELASNFILKTRLQDPRVLSRSETPVELTSFGAVWKSDEAIGGVKIIIPEGDVNGIDVAAAVVAGDAKECKGKFASGRSSELVDSDVVFRGFALCEDAAGSRSAQYFIVPRKRGGFVIFSVVSDMKSEPSKNVVQNEKLADFQRAALITASQ
jgi:hypothetical protein